MEVRLGAVGRVRDYTAHDLDACLDVFDSNVPAYFREHERADFRQFLNALPGPYLVVEGDDGRILACGGYAIVPAERRADLCWGMVRRDLHRGGLGRALTQARIDRALADPLVEMLALNTSQHTVAFYEGFGFEVTEVIRDGFAPGLDRCEMRLRLRSIG